MPNSGAVAPLRKIPMTLSATRFAGLLFAGAVAALPCAAESFASSASIAGSASIGSLSDSVKTSSGSSARNVAEGDYRIVDVAAGERLESLRLKMQHVARADEEAAVVYVDVPQAALGHRSAAQGDIVAVRQRPYGYQFAWGDTRTPFFLVLAADWQRELEPRAVGS